jgi:hypothetical protein
LSNRHCVTAFLAAAKRKPQRNTTDKHERKTGNKRAINGQQAGDANTGSRWATPMGSARLVAAREQGAPQGG